MQKTILHLYVDIRIFAIANISSNHKMNQTDFFKCLSDTTRLDILKLVMAKQNVCVCELTEQLQLSQPKISRHLALLRNLSILLEETAINMRERTFVEKRASSNVLMYVIFVFFAVAFGAPVLFGLSSVLVKTITQILSSVPALDTASTASIPFAITKVSISTTFVTYFSLIYLIITSILSSLVIGVVNKGDEKSGMTYMFPLAILSTSVFFLVQIVILKFILSAIG